jgi:hypothetical protein
MAGRRGREGKEQGLSYPLQLSLLMRASWESVETQSTSLFSLASQQSCQGGQGLSHLVRKINLSSPPPTKVLLGTTDRKKEIINPFNHHQP